VAHEGFSDALILWT